MESINEKSYGIFEACHHFSGGKYYIAAETKQQAIDFYEDEVDGEVKSYRKENHGVLDDLEYDIKELKGKRLEKIRVLEPCGGLWDYSIKDVVDKALTKGQVLPYLVSTGR